jgi:hypothetical protein
LRLAQPFSAITRSGLTSLSHVKIGAVKKLKKEIDQLQTELRELFTKRNESNIFSTLVFKFFIKKQKPINKRFALYF